MGTNEAETACRGPKERPIEGRQEEEGGERERHTDKGREEEGDEL